MATVQYQFDARPVPVSIPGRSLAGVAVADITPPPGMLDHRPEYRREVYGRVTEPWTPPRAAPAPRPSAGVRVPRSNGCTVAGGEMRCQR